MVRPRIIETDNGLQGEIMAADYDAMMRHSRNKGYLVTDMILKAGVTSGLVLEIGPGPGYLGLEWLKRTEGTTLQGLDISPEMIEIAQRNAQEYGLLDRVEYVHGDACQMPFEDAFFDAIFTNATLHEWSDPVRVFAEIHRVLKPGGRYVIIDLRRDMPALVRGYLWLITRPTHMRPGLKQAVNATYTLAEVRRMLDQTPLKGASVQKNPFGLVISGAK